jgi:hypothetical protein
MLSSSRGARGCALAVKAASAREKRMVRCIVVYVCVVEGWRLRWVGGVFVEGRERGWTVEEREDGLSCVLSVIAGFRVF